MSKFNHDRPLSDFEDELKIIRDAGFKPIGVTQMYFEDTYIFETEEESINAYNTFEVDKEGNKKNKLVGWWYSKEDALKEIKKYEEEMPFEVKVRVYWF